MTPKDVIRVHVTDIQALQLSELLYSIGWQHGTHSGSISGRSSFDGFFAPDGHHSRATVKLYPKTRLFAGTTDMVDPEDLTYESLVHTLFPNSL